MATTINFPTSPTQGQLYTYGVTTYVWNGTRWTTQLQITNDVISGSLRVTNGITGSLLGTASYAITASYAMNAGVTVSTGSLLLTASAALNVITFTKGDGTTFPVTVNTGSGGGVTGTGTTNYVPKFTGTSAIGNSLLYDNGTTVSVNTTAPASGLKFEVSGSDIQVNGIRIGRGSSGGDVTNTAMGLTALQSNTTSGFVNTAIGNGAMANNTTGFANTALGANSLSNVVGGYFNIGIGYNPTLLVNSDSNSIVIGTNAVGLGTNTTVIGGPGTTLTAIRGNIALGKDSANARLDVNGNAIITGSLTVTGAITMPARPAFRVTGAGGAKVAVTTLSGSYLNVDYQQGSGWDNATGTFTAPVAGLYQVNVVCRTNTNVLGTISQLIVYKNNTGGTTGTAQIMVEYGANTTMNHTGGSTISKLAVGDTLKMVVTVGEISFDVNDNFSAAYIG